MLIRSSWINTIFPLFFPSDQYMGYQGQTSGRSTAAFASPSLLHKEMRHLRRLQAWIKKECLPRSRAAPVETSLRLCHVGREGLWLFFSLSYEQIAQGHHSPLRSPVNVSGDTSWLPQGAIVQWKLINRAKKMP